MKGQASSLIQNSYFKIELTRNNQLLIIVLTSIFSQVHSQFPLLNMTSKTGFSEFQNSQRTVRTHWTPSPIVSKQVYRFIFH